MQTFVAAVTGGGGWPLNVFLTPDRKAFQGLTYAPPNHFLQALGIISDQWKEQTAMVRTKGGGDLVGLRMVQNRWVM